MFILTIMGFVHLSKTTEADAIFVPPAEAETITTGAQLKLRVDRGMALARRFAL